jgi:hypothetical protein
MAAVVCAIRITIDDCSLEVASDPQSLVAHMQRPMHDSHSIHVCHSVCQSLAASTVESSSGVELNAEILAIKQSKRLMHSINKGQQVAYKLQLHEKCLTFLPLDRVLHPDVQRVINKHSVKGGTLCGKVPGGKTG